MERHALVVEHSPQPILVVDKDGRIVEANDAARALGEAIETLRAPAGAAAEVTIRDPAGVFRRLMVLGVPLASGELAMFTFDVTEQRHLESEVAQLRRVQAIGQAVASVVHDFTNLLAPILYMSELVDRPGDEAEIAQAAPEFQTAVRLAVGLVNQLMAFVKGTPRNPGPVDPAEVVCEMQWLLARMVRPDIELALELDGKPRYAKLDREQLEHAILNLAANARDAMPKGGRLTIGSCEVSFDRPYVASHGRMEPGSYVALIFVDTGVGMSSDVMARMFERHFTTKEQTGGSGLGLAGVERFLAASGGCADVESVENRGTSITIYFPVAT